MDDSLEYLNEDGELDVEKNAKWFEALDEADENDATKSMIGDQESWKPRVVNIIAVAQFNTKFDLFPISTKIRNAEYNPKRMKNVTLRIQKPKATGLVFSNGKINIVGTRSEEEAHTAAKKFGRMMKQIGYDGLRLTSFTISSMIAVVNAQFKIQIDAIARADGHQIFAHYNPENFAGLVYKIPQPKLTLLIFQSGNIVMTGAKSPDDLQVGADWIAPILRNFRQKDLAERIEEEDKKKSLE